MRPSTSTSLLLALSLIALPLVAVPRPALGQGAGDAVERARERFESAVTLADDGRYEEALRLFESVQRERPHRVVVYNIGWCLSRLHRVEEALEAFDAYLDESQGDDPDRIAAARTERHRLSTALEEGNLAGSEDELPPREGAVRLRPMWFWASLGATAAASAVLVVTGALTMHYRSAWISDWQEPDRATGLSLQRSSDAFLGLAICGAAASIVLGLLTDFGRPRPEQPPGGFVTTSPRSGPEDR